MRTALMIVLGVCLCMTTAEGQRTRFRGLRRFSLASPATQTQEQVEDPVPKDQEQKTKDQEPKTKDQELKTKDQELKTKAATPKHRSRGAQLLRRGSSSLRLRNRVVPEQKIIETKDEIPSVIITEAIPKTLHSGRRRGGVRIRRPKRPTTTTTTLIPEVAIVSMPKEEKETPSVLEEEKSYLPILEIKDPEEETNVVIDIKLEEPEIISSVTEAPRKFRPIPIKIGHRRRGHKNKKVPIPTETVQEQTELQVEQQISVRHRFATRNRTPLRTRIRGRGPTKSKVKADDVNEEEKQINPPRRFRVPVVRRRPSSVPTEKLQEIPEKPQTEVPVAMAVEEAPQNEAVRRLPQMEEENIIAITEMVTELEAQTTVRSIFPTTVKRTRVKIPKKDILQERVDEIKQEDKISPNITFLGEEIETSSLDQRIQSLGKNDLKLRESFNLIGTVENTPIEEVHSILSGLGSRRRGLARPIERTRINNYRSSKDLKISTNQENEIDADYLYDFYDYLYE